MQPERPTTPDRFQVSKPTLFIDRFMTHFIKLGGVSVILAVTLIFVFIGIQIVPLFRNAQVEPLSNHALPETDFVALGIDEHLSLPYVVDRHGHVYFQDLTDPQSSDYRGWFQVATDIPDTAEVTAVQHNIRTGQIALGFADGRFTVLSVEYSVEYLEDGGRRVVPAVSALPLLEIGQAGLPILAIDYGDSGTMKLAVAIQQGSDGPQMHAVTLIQRRTLFGSGATTIGRRYDLTDLLTGHAERALVNWEANRILVENSEGHVDFLALSGDGFIHEQTFFPFGKDSQQRVASMDFVLGDLSVVFTSDQGQMNVWSFYRDPEQGKHVWGPTKEFSPLAGGSTYYSAAKRNKAFLTGEGKVASLRFLTTEDVRWEQELPFAVELGIIAPRYNALVFVGDDQQLHLYRLDDPHPQASMKTFFGKIHYEGAAAPSYTWQSTGGRDDFERKLSMVPLLIGTFKGTIYALVFAVPIALLAAIYTSQFLQPQIKRYVKPAMEIMASLPSVVLGFFAALWLAPIVSNSVPSIALAGLGVVLGAAGFGWGWSQMPSHVRIRVKPGWEFLAVLPICCALGWIGWNLGPVLEQSMFVVTNPETGTQVGDFRLWFREVTGLPFEQRNALVVGFVMGFAVIPIIFTLAEDALSNVPEAFRSGSLALGASRWQTALRVVVPTAAAGIFSALMIGFGRAVGETMIVVMATGNVPVTELNPFTGMRTLSANIAVELPEAPQHGTLYRTLFFGAMLLFMLTFCINTVAEILRQRLRQRYRAIE